MKPITNVSKSNFITSNGSRFDRGTTASNPSLFKWLWWMIVLSTVLKLYVAFTMSDKLFVGSDDLGYIGSAKMLLKTGTFSFHQEHVPTVWITPAYPLFLAPFFAFFRDSVALTLVRIAQIVLSGVTIWLSYRIGKRIKNETTGLIAAALVAFYPANILSANLILTETLFTFVLVWFTNLALKPKKDWKTFVGLGIVWAVSSLIRPTIAMIPAVFFLYYWVTRHLTWKQVLQYGTLMFVAGVLVFSPWWIRNYMQFDRFIPFSYADGAPLLEGSFPGNKVDRSVFIEQNMDKIYVNQYYKNLALERIKRGFSEDFRTYLKWYAVEKPMHLLFTSFYWIQVFSIPYGKVVFFHHLVNLVAVVGLAVAWFRRNSGVLFLILPVVYFTFLYSIYFAFDRYGFPQFTLVSIIAAYALAEMVERLRR